MAMEVAGVVQTSDPTLTSGKKYPIRLDSAGKVQVSGTVTTNPSGTQAISAPIGGTYTDRSIANLSGSSETLMSANANRRIFVVHNIGATAIGVNLTGGTASLTAGGSINIPAGSSLILNHYPPTSLITIIGTLNADVTAYEG